MFRCYNLEKPTCSHLATKMAGKGGGSQLVQSRLAELESSLEATNKKLASCTRLVGLINEYCEGKGLTLPIGDLTKAANDSVPELPFEEVRSRKSRKKLARTLRSSSQDSLDDSLLEQNSNKRRRSGRTPSPQQGGTPATILPASSQLRDTSPLSLQGVSPPGEDPTMECQEQQPGELDDIDSTSISPEEIEPGDKKRHPPPVILRQPSLWPALCRYLDEEKIVPRRSVLTSDSVTVYLETVGDFRTFTTKLSSDLVEYSTNQMRQDRPMVVVIRGVLQEPRRDRSSRSCRRRCPRSSGCTA